MAEKIWDSSTLTLLLPSLFVSQLQMSGFVCVIWGANSGYTLGAAVLGARLKAIAGEKDKSIVLRNLLLAGTASKARPAAL